MEKRRNLSPHSISLMLDINNEIGDEAERVNMSFIPLNQDGNTIDPILGKVITVVYECNVCNKAEMKFSLRHPFTDRYIHKYCHICPNCGNQEVLNKVYPYTERVNNDDKDSKTDLDNSENDDDVQKKLDELLERTNSALEKLL